MEFDLRGYRRDSWLGALGAALMLVGDLCLSVIPASATDSGLFQREAYLNGTYPQWRFPLLVATGLLGMVLCFFAVRVSYQQIRPQYRKTRWVVAAGVMIYLSSAAGIHFMIGSLADWTSTLAPLLGREETAALIQAQYGRFVPAVALAYVGMVTLILGSFWAVLTRKTVLPRRMALVHMLVWQVVLVVIPDIRQALGATPATLDFVLSQGSGNASLLLWMLINAVWAGRQKEGLAA